jgi:uncharacterized protein YifE (UPF0438 family)
VNGEDINVLQVTDGITIVAGSVADPQNSPNTTEKVFQEYNTEINKKKTKELLCGREKTVADDRLKG